MTIPSIASHAEPLPREREKGNMLKANFQETIMKPIKYLIAAVAITALVPRANAKTFNWVMYGALPVTHAYSKTIMAAFDRVATRTNGELKIKYHYFKETPYQVNDAADVIEKQLAQMVEWSPAYSSGTYPLLSAPALPALSPDAPSTAQSIAIANSAWQTPTIKKYTSDLLAKYHSMELAHYYWEPMNFWFTSEVSTLDQLRGKKIRAYTPEMADLVAALGGLPESVPTTEQYTALQRNTIEGTITGSGNLQGAKLGEVLKGGYISNFMLVQTTIQVSTRAFAKLPPAAQEVLRDEMLKVQKEILDGLPARDASNQKIAVDSQGMVMHQISASDYKKMRDVSQEKVWPAWQKHTGEQGAQVLKEITEAVEKL